MRLWHQSLIPDTEAAEPYFASLRSHVQALSQEAHGGGREPQVVLHGIDPAVYPPGVTPAELASHAAGELVQSRLILRNVMAADRDGFDAFMIGVLQDTGLRIARSLTDIPVVGYGQAAALVGKCVGDTIGILAFNERLMPVFRQRLEEHVPRSVGPSIDLGLSYSEIMSGFTDSRLDDLLLTSCERLIENGATVIVPGQMLLAELMWARDLVRVNDVPIIDGFAAMVGLAVLLVRLRSTSGMIVNRRTFAWAKPRDAVARLVEHLGPA
jgi:Asp/Glu/hydantoin racemase